MPEPEEPEIDIPFKGMIVTPPNAIVLILEEKDGRDLLTVPDGTETNIGITARVVRDGVEQEANMNILRGAIAIVAAYADKGEETNDPKEGTDRRS